ncbi:MAG: hypothetical protein P8R42_25490 [Candidatus Binatia bacterium]|nr:hypothetical protein [Candidatus Binatia bacterium]
MAAAPPSGSEPQIRCWHCKEPNPPAFFCAGCEAVQSLPSDSNYSSLLGFDGRPSVDEKLLKERYYELSRRLHPDRFQTGSPQEQRVSLQATALLNSAFKTLKDVESRGRWWLEHGGESLGQDNNQVPAGLAAQVFDIQEKISDLSGASGADRETLATELRQVQSDLTERMNEERSKVERLLGDWPSDEKTAGPSRAELKGLLSELSYLRTLARDVRGALEE